jgi:hypothetical protein
LLKCLDEDEEQEAIDFIIDLARQLNYNVEKVCADIGEYNANASIWSKQSLWRAAELMSPIVWWKGLCGKRELAKIAVILLSLPSTSASSERNWSCFGNIKTTKRNRLTVERTMKLVSVKFNLRLLNGDLENCHKPKVICPNDEKQRDDDTTDEEKFEEILIQLSDDTEDEADQLDQQGEED